jgi:hypothetical protein
MERNPTFVPPALCAAIVDLRCFALLDTNVGLRLRSIQPTVAGYTGRLVYAKVIQIEGLLCFADLTFVISEQVLGSDPSGFRFVI